MLDRLPDIATPRLRLRAVRRSDASALFDIFSSEEVTRFWSRPAMTDVAQAEALVEEIEAGVEADTLYEWISTDGSGEVVGTCTLSSLDFDNRRAEIGFAVHRRCWGRGYGAEAAAALVELAFDTLRLERLEADVDPENAASLRVLRRLGFAWEGFLPERYRVGGGVQDTVLLGLLASRWRSLGETAPPGVRTMTPSDRPAVVALLEAQLVEHALPAERAQIEATVDGLLSRPDRGAILVADRGDGPIGVAYLAFSWTLEHGGRGAWLEELYVTPSARGGGLGSALLQAAIDHAKQEGARAIDLEVDETHARSARLYARAGFTSLSRARWQIRL